jgi:hypothetical protein
MTGENEMTLNQDSMCEALQYYFENVVFSKERVPVVKSIEPISKSTNYGDANSNKFLVKVDHHAEAK